MAEGFMKLKIISFRLDWVRRRTNNIDNYDKKRLFYNFQITN